MARLCKMFITGFLFDGISSVPSSPLLTSASESLLLPTMGNSTSTLPPASQPGSPLQLCLNNVLPTAAVSYPQTFLYEPIAVKTYNTRIPVIPAAVTRPSTTKDIVGILNCAAASDVKVQARSGGHSYGNYGLGGEDNAVVVDMVNFQQFSMDKNTWKAKIGSGTRLGDVTKKLHDAGGRAIAHGTCPDVGIGGHATIGGLGPLSRQWGAALDHIVEVEIVLADGTVTRSNSTYKPDILWAVKGAAASFGVVTEFVVQTHPEPGSVVQYSYTVQLGSHKNMWPTFAAWQDIASDPKLDRKLASQLIILPFSMIISGTYFGTKAEYDALGFEKRLATNATNVAVTTADDWLGTVLNWAENEALQLLGGIPSSFYAKSLTFNQNNLIPRTGIKDFFDYLDNTAAGTLLWFAIFDLEGGAVNDVAPDATAYGHRDALFYFQAYALDLIKLSDTSMKFVEGMINTLSGSIPGKGLGAYAGYVDPLLDNAQAEYWTTNLPKLTQVKKVLDPLDRFHNPQSVPVAA
ncbi:Reticuline oxidase [Mycena indigotica]|uniref:Reticuline oxidase n=1 Tax=Mycena indigotica TaxID=2126181 RepID=A0A8H6WC89_9AGAR|nr:Reticuline oxidase [Mycena indigotica]KAF7309498.1 Reticuline oxidase [Mycena indigotica]